MKKVVNIKGNLVKIYTLSDLAKSVGKSVAYLRKMEERGSLPRANFRMKKVKLKDGTYREGARAYTERLCLQLTVIFKTFRQGRKIPDEQRQSIKNCFEEEKVFLKNLK